MGIAVFLDVVNVFSPFLTIILYLGMRNLVKGYLKGSIGFGPATQRGGSYQQRAITKIYSRNWITEMYECHFNTCFSLITQDIKALLVQDICLDVLHRGKNGDDTRGLRNTRDDLSNQLAHLVADWCA